MSVSCISAIFLFTYLQLLLLHISLCTWILRAFCGASWGIDGYPWSRGSWPFWTGESTQAFGVEVRDVSLMFLEDLKLLFLLHDLAWGKDFEDFLKIQRRTLSNLPYQLCRACGLAFLRHVPQDVFHLRLCFPSRFKVRISCAESRWQGDNQDNQDNQRETRELWSFGAFVGIFFFFSFFFLKRGPKKIKKIRGREILQTQSFRGKDHPHHINRDLIYWHTNMILTRPILECAVTGCD